MRKCEESGVKTIYHGETGRCAKVRCGEHARDLRIKAKGSNLYQHVVERHSGDINTEFQYEVEKSRWNFTEFPAGVECAGAGAGGCL